MYPDVGYSQIYFITVYVVGVAQYMDSEGCLLEFDSEENIQPVPQ